jgi:myotubularin-related protein 1/2
MNFNEDYFKLPLFQISKFDKTSDKKNLKKYSLDVTTKDTRVLKFVIVADQLKFYANLNSYLVPKDVSGYYSFAKKYREALFNDSSYDYEDGWKIYDPLAEYKRQGLNFNDDNYKLKLSNLNKNFALCSTYPEILVVPKILTDDEIREASMFRTKCRFPILSYVYSASIQGYYNSAQNNNPTNSNSIQNKNFSYASIWRSSQTKSGLTGNNRSSADEKLLKVISQLNEKLVIYDARPYLNALANRVNNFLYNFLLKSFFHRLKEEALKMSTIILTPNYIFVK